MAELEPDRLRVCSWNHRETPSGDPIPEGNFVLGDLRDTYGSVTDRYRETIGENIPPALLSACPPCQGMSTARGGIGRGDDLKSGEQDERNLLVKVIADVAEELAPKLIVVENVPAFLTRKVPHPDDPTEGISAARLLCRDLVDDYRPFPFLTDLADYGVPQRRQRTFVTLIRRDLDVLDYLDREGAFPYPEPREGEVTLREFLKDHNFPKLDAKHRTRGDSEMDQVPSWSEEQYRMVDAIGEPGGSAWANDCDNEGCEQVELGEDDAVCPSCEEPLPRPTVTDDEGNVRLVKGFRRTSYRRMPLDEPAPTITTASNRIGSDYTIHPTENRLLSPRECQALQTFPESFQWRDPETGEHALELFGVNEFRAMIGEAVPPAFTEKHGRALRGLLEGNFDELEFISADDERCVKAKETLGLSRDLFRSLNE